MLNARWLRRVVVLAVLAVFATACGGQSEPEPEAGQEPAAEAPEAAAETEPEGAAGPGDAEEQSVLAVVPEAAAGLTAALGTVDPSVPPLGDYDRAKVVAAAQTLDPDAVCPPVVAPESLEGVVEVLRIEGGCALVEYVALEGRSVVEVREEILESDPAALAVGEPPRDLVLTADYDAADYDSAPPAEYDGDEYEAGDWWYLDAVGAAKLWQSDGWEYATPDGLTRRVQAWSEEVTVAVLDTGTVAHRDLVGSFADTTGDAWLSLACHHDGSDPHGTHVAGLIAARPNNGQDVGGIAPEAMILPIHLLNEYEPSAVCPADTADLQTSEGETATQLSATQAVRLAAEAGADIVNMSFTWGHVGSPAGRTSSGNDAFEAMIDAMKEAHGTIFVASAGNCGNPNTFANTTTTLACPDGLNTESYPAAYHHVLSVAAVNRANERAVFSTSNSHVVVAMPGDGASDHSGLLSTVPLVSCHPEDTDGDGTTDRWRPLGCGDSANPQACDAATPPRRSIYDTPAACAHRAAHFPGTSMAAPLMSGALAHIFGRYPDATDEQVANAVLAAMTNPDTGTTGTTGTHTNDYGFGILDPIAALQELDRITAEPTPPSTIPPVGDDEVEVTIAVGQPAQGHPDCTSEHCRHLEITILPADADGPYTVECFTNTNPNQPWHTATWHWPTATQWTQGGCIYNAPDHQIWATVTNQHGTATSNTITWPTTPTTQPPQPPEPPPQTTTTTTYTAVSAGGEHSCAIRSDGTITCWGRNSGQAEAPGGTYTAVSVGSWHSCAIRTDGTITCWGDNDDGRTDAPGGVFSAVSVGWDHSCGLRSDATITCWGANDYGQSEAPGGTYSSVSAGRVHSCGLRSDGTITCWGRNDYGQSEAPGGTYSAVSAGGEHSCAVRTDGTITCWYWNGGQIEAPGGEFSAVSAGYVNSCGLRADGTITCWITCGVRRGEPMADVPNGQFISVSAKKAGSQNEYACGIRTDGTITCWGYEFGTNVQGELSIGEFTDIAVGYFHRLDGICGVRADGTLTCWNLRNGSQTMDGTFTAVSLHNSSYGFCALRTDQTLRCSTYPELTGDDSFIAVAAGYDAACAIRVDRTVLCSEHIQEPQGTFNAISDAGGSRFCGIKTDQTLECWGELNEELPVVPSGAFASLSRSCGIRTNGTVDCWWDSNDYGQADAPGGTFVFVSTGSQHSCGIRPSGTVECWGGREDRGFSLTDAPAGTFTAIAAGALSTCGIKTDRTVVCWGRIVVNLNGNDRGGSDPPARGDLSVVLSKGDPGPIEVEPGQGVPCAPDVPTCRYLDVELEGFAPGIYAVSCAHDGWGDVGPSLFWTFSITVDSSGSAASRGPCFLNFARLTGNGVYISVAGDDREIVTSNWLK